MENKFWQKVTKTNSCWLWTGAKSHNGYGRFSHKGKVKQAHRVAWEIQNGREFPAGKLACHVCDNPPCVNPAHLFVGTTKDNMRDASLKGRLKGFKPNHKSRAKKFCPAGHEYTSENTKRRIQKGIERRICRTCYNAQIRARRNTPEHREKERLRWRLRAACKRNPSSGSCIEALREGERND